MARTTKTALLVEDNPTVREATFHVLVELGFTVCEADCAAAAIQATQHQQFDFVLTDISMPGGMSGVDLAKHLRKLYPGLPIVLVTGFSNLLEEVAGEFVVLKKPYQINELRLAIDLEIQMTTKATKSH